jgi:hypothetical protein
MAEGRRRLHNEYLHNLNASPNIIKKIKTRKMRLAGNEAHMEAMRNVYNILFGNFEGKRPLTRPRCRWEDNFRMGLRAGVDWMHLAQDRNQ